MVTDISEYDQYSRDIGLQSFSLKSTSKGKNGLTVKANSSIITPCRHTVQYWLRSTFWQRVILSCNNHGTSSIPTEPLTAHSTEEAGSRPVNLDVSTHQWDDCQTVGPGLVPDKYFRDFSTSNSPLVAESAVCTAIRQELFLCVFYLTLGAFTQLVTPNLGQCLYCTVPSD